MHHLKRVPWWAWGLVAATLGTIGSYSGSGYPYPVSLNLGDILFTFLMGAVIYVPLAGAIAWGHNRWKRTA